MFDPANPKPGRYDDLPIEVYHKGPGISRSALKILEDGTPRDLQHYLEHGITPTEAMDLGSALDMLFFEPERVEHEIVTRRSFDQTKVDLRNKLEWYAEITGGDIPDVPDDIRLIRAEIKRLEPLAEELIIDEAIMDQARAMDRAARRAPSVRALLKEIEPQPSYYYERDGILVKSRPDARTNGFTWDLKSVHNMSERARWRAIIDHGYDAQAAMARDGTLAAKEKWKGHIILWVGKDEPHDVHLQLIEEGDVVLDLGEKRYEKWLAKYTECVRTGRWPDRSALIGRMKTPKWVARKLEDEIELENERAKGAQENAA